MKKLAFSILSLIFLLCLAVGFVGCNAQNEQNSASTHTHSFTEQKAEAEYLADAATCTQAATYYYSCTCGESERDDNHTFSSGNELGHSFGDWVTIKEPTETAKGLKTRTCTRSGCGFSENEEIPELIHTHKFTVRNTNGKYLAVAATCTQAAKYYYSCTCGKKGTLTFTSGNALGHSFTNYVSDNNATHTQDGTKTAKCDRCDVTDTVTDEGTQLAASVGLEYDGNTVTGIGTCTDTRILIPKYSPEGNLVTSIGRYAFDSCSGLVSIVIPDSVTSIDYRAFAYCSGLMSIVIPDSVTSIGESAFDSCSGITRITIPDRVTSIGASAFRNCSGLTSIIIPDSVTFIDQAAFQGCSGLTSIIIPDSVTYIGQGVFMRCSGLTSMTVAEGNKTYYSKGNCIISTSGTLVSGCNNSEIPTSENITSIGQNAFNGCSGLTSITIPDSVTFIGNYAFRGCSGLENIYITDLIAWCNISGSDSWIKISYSSGLANLMGCTSVNNLYLNNELITDLVIPDGVISIGEGAFINCSGITSVTIPDSVTSIGNYAFRGCSGLTSITIPDSVTSIGNYAFRGCSGLTSITIPDGVTSIGDYAFRGCSGITSVTIPDSVTSIGEGAFEDCSGLTRITIPDRVTSIGNYAFWGCSGLTSITLPFIGAKLNGTYSTDFDYIFGGSYSDIPSSLKMVIISNGSGVTSIGSNAFYGCSGLENIYITDIAAWCNIEGLNNLMGYGSENKKLYLNNELITDLVIPDSVTSIGSNAFDGCSGLTSIVIPDSVTSIGSNAFV